MLAGGERYAPQRRNQVPGEGEVRDGDASVPQG